jgi:hypothetical protein
LLSAARAADPAERPMALREAARELRAHLLPRGRVHAVRTIDAGRDTLAAAAAFAGAARALGPQVTVLDRVVWVRFSDPEGAERTLAWGVRDPHRAAVALDRAGLSPEAVDLLVLGDLQGVDLRALTGGGERRFPFPSARVVVQRREAAAAAAPHPAQREAYAGAHADSAEAERLAVVEGDAELGGGVAVVWTPGRSDGHQSLCLAAPGGPPVAPPGCGGRPRRGWPLGPTFVAAGLDEGA